MSRIGKMSIKIPLDVNIKIKANNIIINGKFGTLIRKIPDMFSFCLRENNLHLIIKDKCKHKKCSSLHGLYRTLIFNMVKGVSTPFIIILKLNGVGYKAIMENNEILLNVGYSHEIRKSIPSNVSVEIVQNVNIILKSCDKEKVGLFASQIRACRVPEPYKGKGILLEGERVIYKKGKLNKK